MRLFRCLLIFIIVQGIVALFANATVSDTGDKSQFAADRFLVKLTEEAISETNLPTEYNARAPKFGIIDLDSILKELRATAVIRAHIRPKDSAWEQKTGFDRWFLVEVPIGTDILKAVETFKLNRWIETSEPEHYLYPMQIPNDQYYTNNWGHNNTRQLLKWDPPNNPNGSHSGVNVGLSGFDSNAELAWDFPQSMGNTSIVIAIIDTGFDRSHPDLRYITGYDFGCGDASPDFTFNVAHGTCCAGIAAAISNNSIGVSGVAGGCSVMPLKVTDSWGYISGTAINNSLIYAADHGADVISMSYGSTNGLTTNTYEDDALEYAYTHGVSLFAATGNDNHSPICYPAYNQYVISVGAASPEGSAKSSNTCDGEYWWGSNWGTNIQNDRFSVDIMGPTILPTTDIVGSGGYDPGNYDMFFNGTSCATPYVAGVAALLKARNPSLTPEQVRTALTSTAIDMYSGSMPGWDRYTGYGFVNASAALTGISGGTPFCRISSPLHAHGQTIGTTVRVSVTAYDTNSGGSINRVEFYLDNILTYTDTTYPYSWDWNTTGVSYAAHNIAAKAFDNDSNNYSQTISQTMLYAASDGFEATFLSTLPWITTGTADWYLETDDSFSGTKAVCSGNLTENGDTSTLSCTVNITTAGTYYFYRKLVSEVTYDYLRFYLDNVQLAEWSGNVGWYWFNGTVTTGVHTFKWVYTQGGGSVHYGKAYLDHFKLPAYSASTNPDIQWGPSTISETLPVGSFAAPDLHISNWNSPTVNFLAYFPCSTVSVLDETFLSTTFPAGWTPANETGSAPWRLLPGGYSSQPPAAFDGQYNARMYNSTATAASSRLSAPVMDLSLSVSATLTFWHTQVPVLTDGQGGLGVYYKASSGGTWTLLQSYTNTISNWTREVINLPNLSSTYYLSFVGGAVNGYGICVDKVVVTKQSYAESSTSWARFETASYISGSIGSMSFYSYPVMFSSIGLTPGTYTSSITITSNCTANPVITIPVTLSVYDPAALSAPDSLTITRSPDGDAVILHWAASPGFPTGYKLYKAYLPDFSDAIMIGTVPAGQTGFVDPSEFTMRKAYYRVTAYRD